jgi:cellulose biosynthesis protein BcsQ
VTVLISIFNAKGAVSKTTTAFNLGWMLATKGKTVLLVDCDPQCSLTEMVLSFGDQESTEDIQGRRNGKPLNIREGLAPVFESRPTSMKAVNCITVPGADKLLLMPGHIGLAEYEVTLGIAQELSGLLPTLRNIPGSLRYLVDITAQSYRTDIVIVDMSPSLGAINQNLLSVSDYFIIPTRADHISTMAINSLANVFPKWRAWGKSAGENTVLKSAEYPFPILIPKFLGYVVQGDVLLREFEKWIDQLKGGVKDVLLPALRKSGMMLSPGTYDAAGYSPEEPILQMPDFSSLIASSDRHRVPIFELTTAQLEQRGQVIELLQKSQENFRILFNQAAQRVISAINADRSQRI